MRGTQTKGGAPETVCLGAILKDEDPFVEEWVAYHRLLGIDHFYLYDNDPRQPLRHILALHQDYVTVRPWLVDHDDERYPGRTKQLKAYNHCLEHDAAGYNWVTFIDGDEFIVLEKHRDLKSFLAEFEGYDAVALNWHVFGHNGYYDDPPGLIIESLTRRMREPRAITKSLARTDAISSITSAHLYRLKKGRRVVDANKRTYREEVYPGKTRVARINHYQCRSFTHWMRKWERGEVGVLGNEPESAWRFSREGCLRQFVSQIATDKNEIVDNSMWRHMEPVNTYLNQLRRLAEIELGRGDAAHRAELGGAQRIETKPVHDENGARHLACAEGVQTVFASPVASRSLRVLLPRLGRSPRRLWSLLTGEWSRLAGASEAIAHAKAASRTKDWPRAAARWQTVLGELRDNAPAMVYRHLGRAHLRQGNLEKAELFLREGLVRYPNEISLIAEQAETALARKDWGQAARCGHAILDVMEAKSDRVLDERYIIAACLALMEAHDYARVFSLFERLRLRRSDSRSLQAVTGFAYLRSAQMETARRHWAENWRSVRDDQDFAQQRTAKRLSHHGGSPNYFEVLTPANDLTPDRFDGRFCIYTALFGEYDELRAPVYAPPGLQFICFSDRPRTASGWDVRVVDLKIEDPFMWNRKLKILPYDHLQEHDYSLYLDPNMMLLGDPLVLHQRWLKDKPFVAWRHPERTCLYDELEAILASACHEPTAIIDQYTYFREQAVPESIPIIEASFLWRDHHSDGVRGLMERLWDHLAQFRSRRDQPGLGYLMWKTGVRPAVLPDYLGTSRANEFVHRFSHKQTYLDLERAQAEKPVLEKEETRQSAGRQPSVREGPASKTRPRLKWVCREKFRMVASTIMRGYQLANIAALHLDGRAEVGQVNELQTDALSDAILILTKGYLKEASPVELARLKDAGNTICADYVDDPARDDLHEYIDAYIAASIAQFIHCSDRYPDKLVHLITHHSDPRLSGIRGPKDYCNIGYFGEIVNARHASELQGLIDFCLINTKASDASWIPRLKHCNVHYAVRNRRPIDGFKPFLKGFTAAQCEANIVVPKDESDALYYLGSDYPYILKDDTLSSVLEMIDHVKASFGGAEWHRGLEIIKSVQRRCDSAQIGREIEALIFRC